MIESILHDLSGHGSLPLAVTVFRLTAAAVFAACIGFERELKAHPAGLRTHMLVSLAAAMFAIMAIETVSSPVFSNDHVRADPLRAIEAVTAGVAFLAAGFIIVSRGHVRGVTTGAGIWLAAGIGLSTGFGYWTISISGTVIGALIIIVLRYFEAALSLKD